MVADAIGAPAERKLAEVACADDHAAFLVGEAEEIVGAQARLHILKGDVVHLLALGEGVAEVGEHLVRHRLDVDLARVDAEFLHQRVGVGLRALSGGEARHGDADDILALRAHHVEGAHGDEKRLR